jgi:hypothetical protein
LKQRGASGPSAVPSSVSGSGGEGDWLAPRSPSPGSGSGGGGGGSVGGDGGTSVELIPRAVSSPVSGDGAALPLHQSTADGTCVFTPTRCNSLFLGIPRTSSFSSVWAAGRIGCARAHHAHVRVDSLGACALFEERHVRQKIVSPGQGARRLTVDLTLAFNFVPFVLAGSKTSRHC